MTLLQFETNDTDDFAERMLPVSGPVRVEARAPTFTACSRLARLPRIGFFRCELSACRLQTPAFKEYSLTIPLLRAGNFGTARGSRLIAPGRAHLCPPGRRFIMTVPMGAPMLVANIATALLHDIADADQIRCLDAADSVSLTSVPGARLYRELARLWTHIGAKCAWIEKDLAIRDAELAVARELLASVGCPASSYPVRRPSKQRLENAEQYVLDRLDQPVTPHEVARHVSVTPAALSRLCRKRHGTSTRDFIKHRRLEAVHRSLLGANRDVTTVTRLAIEHGFVELGRFAADYGRFMGELPSETLAS